MHSGAGPFYTNGLVPIIYHACNFSEHICIIIAGQSKEVNWITGVLNEKGAIMV